MKQLFQIYTSGHGTPELIGGLTGCASLGLRRLCTSEAPETSLHTGAGLCREGAGGCLPKSSLGREERLRRYICPYLQQLQTFFSARFQCTGWFGSDGRRNGIGDFRDREGGRQERIKPVSTWCQSRPVRSWAVALILSLCSPPPTSQKQDFVMQSGNTVNQ